MPEWNGTITLSKSQLPSLDSFIHHPDARQSDIFAQGELAVDEKVKIDWIIKHDLFEGVVLHVSLMAEEGSSFLAGAGLALASVDDALTTLDIEHGGQTYHVRITSE